VIGSLTGPSDPLTAYIVQAYVVFGVSPVTVPFVVVPVKLALICASKMIKFVTKIVQCYEVNLLKSISEKLFLIPICDPLSKNPPFLHIP